MKGCIVAGFITIISLLFANQALADTTWVTFLPGYPEGTPPVVNVVTSDENHTVVEIITPGMWVEEIEEGGEITVTVTKHGYVPSQTIISVTN